MTAVTNYLRVSVITPSIASDVRRPRRGRSDSDVGVMFGSDCCRVCCVSTTVSVAVEAVVDGGSGAAAAAAVETVVRSGLPGGVARKTAVAAGGRRLIWEMLWPWLSSPCAWIESEQKR